MPPVQNFIKSILGVSDPEELKTLTSKVLSTFGFGMYSYISYVPESKEPPSGKRDDVMYVNATFVQSTYPKEWFEYYVSNDMLYTDPIIQWAKTSFLPFTWDSRDLKEGLTHKQKALFKAARKFGIRRGAIVPIHAPGGEYAVFALAYEGTSRELQDLWKESKTSLHMVAIYYHAAVWEQILKRKTAPTPALSPRERQTLQWAARGKTAWETAAIMGISEGTAKTYLKGAMRKLETANKTHAVSKALLHGLINV